MIGSIKFSTPLRIECYAHLLSLIHSRSLERLQHYFSAQDGRNDLCCIVYIRKAKHNQTSLEALAQLCENYWRRHLTCSTTGVRAVFTLHRQRVSHSSVGRTGSCSCSLESGGYRNTAGSVGPSSGPVWRCSHTWHNAGIAA